MKEEIRHGFFESLPRGPQLTVRKGEYMGRRHHVAARVACGGVAFRSRCQESPVDSGTDDAMKRNAVLARAEPVDPIPQCGRELFDGPSEIAHRVPGRFARHGRQR
jgi:hypothetical protein